MSTGVYFTYDVIRYDLMTKWNWTPRAHALAELLTLAFCVGVYWLSFWVLF
jgi:hypothetical protein